MKEVLFAQLGWSDLAWSRKVGIASLALLVAIAEAELAAGRSLILESNFRPEFDTPRLLDLRRRVPYVAFQIYCEAAGEVLIERFKHRWEAGERHPGFIENEQIDSFAATHLGGAYQPLAIEGHLHRLDTTDFASLDLDPLFAALRTALSRATFSLQ